MAKHIYLTELVKEEQMNFIPLSETGIDDFSKDFKKAFVVVVTSFGIA